MNTMTGLNNNVTSPKLHPCGRVGEFLNTIVTFRSPIVVKEGNPQFAQALIEAEAKRVRFHRTVARLVGIPLIVLILIVIVLITPLSGFRINNLRIVGTADPAQQQAIAQTLASIQGQPLLFIDTDVVARLIAVGNGDLKDISVERAWLTGLRVRANARTPMMVLSASDKWFLVDGTGYILGSLESTIEQVQELNLPIVVSSTEIGDLNPIKDPNILNAAEVILNTPPEFKDYVTQWYADGQYGLKFRLESISYGDLEIADVEFGKAEKISEKFSTIHNLLKQLAVQGKTNVTINVWAPANPVIK